MNEKCKNFITDKSGKEIQAHGTVEFPCAIYYDEKNSSSSISPLATTLPLNAPSSVIPWHWHEEFEAIYIKEGKSIIQVLGKEYCFNKGTVAIINANTLHSILADSSFTLESIVFSPFLIAPDTQSAFYKKYIYPLMSSTNFSLWSSNRTEDISNFEKAYSAQQNKIFAYEFAVRESLSSLLLAAYKDMQDVLTVDQGAKNRDAIRMESMLSFIHENFSTDITLSEIAKSASLSEREALRCFQRAIHDTPIQYLSKYRLMKGADMLLDQPDKNITEIALACGFDSFSYFSKQFKLYYHITPTQYRKNALL